MVLTFFVSEVSPKHPPTTIRKAHAYNMSNHLYYFVVGLLKSGDFLKQQVIKQKLYINYVLIYLISPFINN